MRDELWKSIKAIRDKTGISRENFDTMKSRGCLPEKHIGAILLASQNTPYKLTVEDLMTLTKPATPIAD